MELPTTTSPAEQHLRFRRVLEYIDDNLDDDLTVDRLCSVAALSRYHFHRQFSALTGVRVGEYVRLVRLRRASYQLAFREHNRIIDVALASGYESHEAFTRAFRRTIGQTPSQFREQPEWSVWYAIYQHVYQVRSQYMKQEHRAEQVRIVNFEETPVAVLEHCGDPRTVGDTVRRFIDWRKQNRLPPHESATFNILHNDPGAVPPEEYRIDICAATARAVADNPFGVVGKAIPAGRCAVLRHVGSEDTLGAAVHYLYWTWFPESGEELREFPLYLQRVQFYPDVPESGAVTDIFLPLA